MGDFKTEYCIIGPDISSLCCPAYIPGMYFLTQSVSAAAAALACCCAAVVAAAAVVRHRVPDVKKIDAGPSNLMPVSSLPYIQTRYIFIAPRGSTLSPLLPRFAYNISSVITGMRGAKAGVSPRPRSLSCKYTIHEPYCNVIIHSLSTVVLYILSEVFHISKCGSFDYRI